MDDVVDRKNPPRGTAPPEHFFGRVLKPAELLEHARYSVPMAVAEGLRPWVRRYWSVNWDLPEGERFHTATVSEPGINLTVEFGDIYRANTSGTGTWLTGPVTTRRFDVGLYGRGGVIGVNFHLGGTLAFAHEPPALIRDTTVPASGWFSGIDEELGLNEQLAVDEVRETDVRSAAEVLESWLLSRQPRMTEGYSRFTQVLDLLDDPSIISLGELSSRCETSERSLQRMFREYCGVGVKRILTRARVRDAVAAIDQGWDRSFAELAALLGWFDQSHFTADFHRVTGYTPTEYLGSHEGSSLP
ncbi:helix-turn-helix transcriptional regulator [Brevibacterium sandarakinum]|uniref:helix-turn-helix transcriptional regulator n=1 Tax=Brevibacterium sandarakinum TaxID=629680 RepID=UPI00264B8388|nr:helix-turn-helix transcriptional regulator [Brevibacterium sandarakinum]MDN5656196.1 helix-turn-helix transcriptional regulator [Brevibacterium sandarakinum]